VKQIKPRPPIVLPNPDGISILSFTPAFSFSLYTHPPENRKKKDSIYKPQQKTISEKQKVLPVIKEKKSVRRSSDVANLSKKIQRKLSNPNPIAKYVKKSDSNDEDKTSRHEIGQKSTKKSGSSINTNTSKVVTMVQSKESVMHQVSNDKGCQTDPELYLTVVSDPDLRTISITDVDILENVNNRAVQTGPSLIQVDDFECSSRMTIQVADGVIIEVKDYL
jgi:hypothetical protein